MGENTMENGNEEVSKTDEPDTRTEDEVLRDEIRRFTGFVSSSSLRQQQMVYVALTKAIDRANELPETYIKGLVKLVTTACAKRYGQPQSFQLAERLIDVLAKHDSVATVRHVAANITALYPVVPNISKSSSKSALPVAKWILKWLPSTNDSDKTTVMGALASVAFYCCVSKKASDIFSKKLQKSLKRCPEGLVHSGLTELAKDSTCMDKTLCIVAYVSKVSDLDVSAIFVDLYSKSVLLAKIRPEQFVVNSCRFALEKLTLNQFEDQFLPNIKKSILRSPEVAMYGIWFILKCASFPLDKYAEDVAKAVSPSLLSTDDQLRQAATSVVVALAAASQPPAIKKLLTRLFDQLGAAKSAEQRVTLLKGVGECATTRAASGLELDSVADYVISKTAKTDKDTNESTVTAQWGAAVAWCNRLSSTSAALVDTFKEAQKLPAAVRYIGYSALAKIVVNRGLTSLPSGSEECLWKELDNAQKDALESIGLTLVLLKTSKDNSEEKKNAWTKFYNNEILFREKSLSSIQGDDACMWAELVERLVIERPHDQQTSYPPVAMKSLPLLLLWPHWEVRKRALQALDRILMVEGFAFAEALLLTIYNETVNGNIDQMLRIASQKHDVATWVVPGEWYVAVLLKLLSVKGDGAERVAIPALLFACVPKVVEVDGSVWLRWLHELENRSWTQSEQLRADAIEKVLHCQQRDVRDTALVMLVRSEISVVRDALWTTVMGALAELETNSYTRITEKDVTIYKTHDGQLFNTAVLDFDETADQKNARRENKAYSYKEQMQELQLRRELAAKMRKEGKLTPKQKQVMEKELAVEKEIRTELTELYVSAELKLDEARAMVAADQPGAFSRPTLLFDVCLPLTRSYLVGTEAAQLFLAYRDAAFPHSEDYLHELIGSCWLRVVGSRWRPENWASEPLKEALKRGLSLLNERSFVVDTGDDDPQEDLCLFEDAVGADQLTVLFPMIRLLLTSGDYSDDIQNDCLQLLQSSIHKRFLKDDAVLNLPMCDYASLLLQYYADKIAPAALQALTSLVGLVNETMDRSDRVSSMVCEIMRFLTLESHDVRANILRVISAPQLLPRLCVGNESFSRECMVRVFVARFDDMESVSTLATHLWLASLFTVKPLMVDALADESVSRVKFIRESAARGLASFVEELPKEMTGIIDKLGLLYTNLSEIRPAEYDHVGRLQKEATDEWECRSGVGMALLQLSERVDAKDAEKLVHIVVPLGLEDRHPECRNLMRQAAVEALTRHGREILPTMLPFLEKMSDNTPNSPEFDALRQGLVVLMGTMARFLEPSSDKVRAIVARLIEALHTPSQTVQESVSKCLAPLVPSIKDTVRETITQLTNVLFNGDTYGQRRGAAYGIAGLVKGIGMGSIKDMDINNTLNKAMGEKKNAKRREGGLLLLEILCSTMGKLFEPYIPGCLPQLLLCFGDTDENVRKAAEDTAKALMGALSPHGIKIVLPSLLHALDDDSWRTKCAATELLGSMAFCTPRQLSSCLPNIIPKLIEVLADSSSKVQRSGEKALRQIARVVRNPEILGVTNQIMIGLLDPANKTSAALQAVLNTKFVHYIDAPSLALLMPIVRRAFEDRNSETRRVAAQIIANIYNLTEHKDMEPYLSELVPGLQKSLLDPVPEIRSVSAKALGAIVSKSTGKISAQLQESVIPWLKERLISPVSTVDRSGAAQGLCEVCQTFNEGLDNCTASVMAGVGGEQLDHVMPEIIAATESTEVSAETRDGYILMYIYLPMVFGERFVQYLPMVVPPILKALADENEYVRASALKAGQRLIAQYCSHARRLLLPQLQTALCDENWRIRHAAVTLIGDFLFNISGVSGKSTTSTANEDDTMGMEHAGKTITRALGQQCRDRVIAGLYLVRSDVALLVRQAAGHVWKIVVSNTPRTLKEVMKVLFEMVVDSLASPCEERQQCGAKCLGELVRKMGDKIINEILPVLELNQQSEDVEKRVGVAVALHEIIDNMSKDVLNHYLSILVPAVRCAICDDEPSVRSAAADTFSVLYHGVGHDALDEIITPLLEQLTPEQDHILEGLCEVMKQNSRQMLPYLLPRLTKPPINVHALCSLAAVAGDSLSRQLPRVLDALLLACESNDQYDPMIDSCEKVVLAVADEDGVPVLSEYLLQRAAKGNVPAAVLLHTFIDKAEVDLSELTESLLPGLLQLYSSESPQIVDHAILAAATVTQRLDAQQMLDMLGIVKKTLNPLVAGAKNRKLPGFAHPKALQPLLPMFREGILQGGQELKTLAGESLSMVIGCSEPAALKAHVVNITGPLIRVLGDRYSAAVKLAILDALSRLLDKVDAMLRPFLPQLQSTFVKALQEPLSKPVRLAAGGALARLLKIHPKPEPLVTELFKVLGNSQDLALLESTFVTARSLVAGSAPKLSAATFAEGFRVCEITYSAVLETPSELDNSLTIVSGALLGQLAIGSGQIVEQKIFQDVESGSNPRVRLAKSIALLEMCRTDAGQVWASHEAKCRSALYSAFTADVAIASAALRAASYILMSGGESPDRELLSAVARGVNHPSIDVRRVTSIAISHVLAARPEPLSLDLLKLVIPQLVNGTKESNSTVRSAAELALVYAFKMQKDSTVFETYRNSVEGAAKTVLDEVQVCLRRVIKAGDLGIDTLYNVLSV